MTERDIDLLQRYLGERFDRVEERMDRIEGKQDKTNGRIHVLELWRARVDGAKDALGWWRATASAVLGGVTVVIIGELIRSTML